MGDYDRSQVNTLVDKPTITGSAVEHYLKICPGKKALIFASSIGHSKHVVEQFKSAGIRAYHLDGETSSTERDEVMEKFKQGELDALSNVELFGEGYDCPSVEVAILLRPTQSLSLYLQQIGRVLRPCEGKTHSIILDHVGNCQRHGFPDEFRNWSLGGHAENKRGTGQAVKVKICPRCLAAQGPSIACKNCGYFFPVNTRIKVIEQKDGVLSEVDLEKERKRKASLIPQGNAKTVDDLVLVAMQRGYNRPYEWAKHVFRARQGKVLL
jgi:superfamily II DNA or RNA helicase